MNAKKLLLVTLSFFLGLFTVKAQNITTAGDEFWVGFAQNAVGAGGATPTLRLQITSKFNTTGLVTAPAGAFNQPFTVVPGVPTTVTVPTGAYMNTAAEVPQNMGLLITSNDYISVSAENVEDASTDAARVLPRQAIRSEYIVTTYDNTAINTFTQFLIVATENGTQIEITPTQNTTGGKAAGVTFTVTLNEGQSYLVQSANNLTGTIVKSTDPCKAIAVFGGASCASVPNPGGGCCCDHLYEQIVPEVAWGKEYYTTGFRTGERVRIIASQNNTTVTVNGGAPVVLNRGGFHNVAAAGPTPYHIVADKPIAVFEFAPSGDSGGGIGDPFMSRTFSIEQGIDTINFATIVGVNNNHLVSILCSTITAPTVSLSGVSLAGSFAPHPQNPDFSIANHFIAASSVSTAYVLGADGPMVAMIHGYGPDDSYAFSGGGFVNNLSINVDYPKKICVTDSIYFDDEISYAYTAISYDFGDGNSANISDPGHIYANPGIYEVTLAVEELPCLDPDTIRFKVRVDAEKDSVDIQGPSEICPDQSAFFNAITTEPGVTYTWDFDGGTVISGSGAGPIEVQWSNIDTVYVICSIDNPDWVCPAPEPDTHMVVVDILINPDAGPDINTCSDRGFLGATMTTTSGTGEWFPPTGIVVNNPNDPTSNYIITGGEGTYTLIWEEEENGCSNTDTVDIIYSLIAKPDAGPDGIVCGMAFDLAANSNTGMGFWSGDEAISFQDATNDTTVAFADSAGVYAIVWNDTTLNGCRRPDTLMVSFLDTLKPYAGMEDSICGTFTVLDADQAPTPGNWSSPYPGALFSNPSDPKSQAFIPPFAGTQVDVPFVWTLDNGTCSESDTVIISFFNLPAADAGTNDSTCGMDIQLNATPTTGVGTWSATDGNGNAIPATFSPDNTTPNANVSVSQFGSFYMVWTVDMGSCITSDSVEIGFFQDPTPFAGVNDTICALSYNLNAAASLGSGHWESNNPSATWADETSPNTTVFVNGFGVSDFYWIEQNGACTNSDTVSINFFESAAIDIVQDSAAFCGNAGSAQATMNKPNQNGFWSSTSAGLSFGSPNDSSTTVNGPFGCHEIIYSIDYGSCLVTDTALVCFFEMPNTNAGADDTVCGTSTVLNAIASLGQGTWSALSVGNFVDPNSPSTSVSVSGNPFGTYGFVWTEVNGACTNSDTVFIDFREQPTALAGMDQAICDSSFTISASPSVSPVNGVWTSQPAGVVFANANSANTSAYVPGNAYGTYSIIWTEQNTICTDSDTLELVYYQQPQTVAGNDTNICANTYTLQGALTTPGSTGLWTSSPAGLNFTDNTNPNDQVSVGSNYGTYELIWTETNGTCVDADTVIITFTEQTVADAGVPAAVCALTHTLSANPSVTGANGTWSSVQGGATFGNPNAANTNVTVNAYGVYDFVWTESNGICSSTDQVQISFEQQPNLNVTVPDSICGTEYTLILNHSVPGSIFTISNRTPGLNSTAINDSTFSIFIGPSSPAYGCHSFTLTEDNLSCSDQVNLSTCFYESPNPYAGVDSATCGTVYALSANPPVGDGMWIGPAGVVFSDPTSPQTTVDVSAAGFGTYTFGWQDENEICTDVDYVDITFFDDPVIACNCDEDTVYTTDPYFQFVDSTDRAVSWAWNFGDGNTSTEQSPNHGFFTYGEREVTLTVTDQFGCSATKTCKILIIDDTRFFVPNAFTPDNDNINEEFGPSLIGHLPGTFEMWIYDRWGKRVFYTDDLEEKWNGHVLGSAERAPSGSYAVHIRYQTFNEEEHNYRGQVVLVR